MKTDKYLIMLILLSVNVFAESVTATYSNKDIPTTYMTSSSVSTSSRAAEPGLLTVTIPVGVTITSIDVTYKMTATSEGYMSEQRSFLRCISSGGIDEVNTYSGTGNISGTFSYSRTGLTIANSVIGGGDIQFELHAFRIYGGDGSNVIYNYVNNNSWQITVNYQAVPVSPSNLTTTAFTNQMKIDWMQNAENNNVIIAYNLSNTFGTPINGIPYSSNSPINGGGTVIYNGNLTSYYHLGLDPNTKYYYKIWSVNENNLYSIGITGSNTTNPQNASPVVSNVTFINNMSTTGKVDIYYDVIDAEQDHVTISMEVSNDGGITYSFPCTQLSGAIGSVAIGTGKHIIWNFAREHSGVAGEDFKFKIIADDNVGDQTYYAGQIYNTVTIGSQTWLKENLNVGTMINNLVSAADNSTIEKYCYNNNEANCTTYGGLYQWNEAMQYVKTEKAKGICPAGWHIPTKSEFKALSELVGGKGNVLKAIGQGYGNGAGSNGSGFSALLAGSRVYYDGSFYAIGYYSNFWSTSPGYYASEASRFCMNADSDSCELYDYPKDDGFSVRCLRD